MPAALDTAVPPRHCDKSQPSLPSYRWDACACEDVLPLLLQTPNGQHNAGSNRDRFIMQPAATSAEQLQWYELIGVLMAN